MSSIIINLLFLNRKSTTYSIEKVFKIIEFKLCKHANVSSLIAKSSFEKPVSIFINLIYFFYNIYFKYNEVNLYHITGVLHYISILLPSNKSILTIHDCIKYHQQSGLKKIIVRYLWFKIPLAHLKYVTSISEYTKNEIIQITGCNPNKIKVIYNAFDPKIKFHPKKFNSIKPKILHIGTTPNKNTDRLIDSLKSINCQLVIIGRLNSHTQKKLILNNVDYINLFDLSDNDIIEQYKLCDIVSFITTYEGFGLPIIEAQATGRVVITSSLNPHIEIGGNAAYYVNPYDIKSISDGLRVIIDDCNIRNKLIMNGKENILRFQADKISNQYLEYYTLIVSKQKSKI